MKVQANVAKNTTDLVSNGLQVEANATLAMCKQPLMFPDRWLCNVGCQKRSVAHPQQHACVQA